MDRKSQVHLKDTIGKFHIDLKTHKIIMSGKFSFSIALCVLFLYAPNLFPQAPKSYPTIGEIRKMDPELENLISGDAKIEVLASGFEWVEGPLWVKDSSYFLFSDVPNNKILKWKEGEGVSVFMQPSGYTGISDYGDEPGSNGLLLDDKGQLVVCEHGDRRISVLIHNGGKRTLVDNYKGKRLNSPNDGVFRSNGDLYFTDPPYGLPKHFEDSRRELEFCGVYRLTATGKLELLTKGMSRPNGIAFSPDEKTLYVAQSDPKKAIWKAFVVNEDGSLGKSRVFYDATALVGKVPGLPDGMKVDKFGNLWATGPGGIHIFNPSGTLLGRIETGGKISNCAWGDDGTVLYFTADDEICRIKTKSKGVSW